MTHYGDTMGLYRQPRDEQVRVLAMHSVGSGPPPAAPKGEAPPASRTPLELRMAARRARMGLPAPDYSDGRG